MTYQRNLERYRTLVEDVHATLTKDMAMRWIAEHRDLFRVSPRQAEQAWAREKYRREQQAGEVVE